VVACSSANFAHQRQALAEHVLPAASRVPDTT